MSIEYIRYRIPEAQAADFEVAYRRASVPLASAPQCADYELTRCEEDPEYYILRITWTSTADHLEGFRGSDAFRAFFAEIKPYVSAIEEMRHYRPTGIKGRGSAAPTPYTWAGGASALERLFTAFYAHVSADPELAPLSKDMDPAHPHHVAAWFGEALGGPPVHSDKHGVQTHMFGRHLGKAITERQRRRWMNLLLDTADEVGLPEDPEFRATIVGCLEWGTRMAVRFSRPGASTPGTDEPVPVPVWDRALPPWQPQAGTTS
ncbi:globin domain-containing protein [Streptomyces sp. LZ34]